MYATTLASGAVAAGALRSAAAKETSKSPNEKVVVGVMGLKRGSSLVSTFSKELNALRMDLPGRIIIALIVGDHPEAA